MKIVRPAANSQILISSGAVWPSAVVETDATGPHVWNWDVTWKTFKVSGVERTPANQWDAVGVITNFGGALTVRAQAGADFATSTVTVKGTNPSAADVTQFLSTKPNSGGFDKILQHESAGRHFGGSGEPLKSFDGGYGMCQLTTPTPSFDQVWSWKKNIEGGLALFAAKRAAALNYLGQSNRAYTEDQVVRESVCRWNGGPYHVWDGTAGVWVRPATMLCDSATGNIGWNMTDAENSGKTEAELHKRDSGSYSKPPAAGAHWKYSGVCYADAILG